MGILKIKRVYDTPSADDGARILVDKSMPRGIPNEQAAVDYWFKEIAPSIDLKEWLYEEKEFDDFKAIYIQELETNNKELKVIAHLLKDYNVTLLYNSKNRTVNHAVVLKDFIEKKYADIIASHKL